MPILKHCINILFCVCFTSGFAQKNKTKHHLYYKQYYSTKKALGFSNKAGIDSIHFPIDTTKIKLKVETKNAVDLKLDAIKHLNSITYFYYFTPLVTEHYKLPNATVFSGGKATQIKFTDSIYLHFTSQATIDKAELKKKNKIISRLKRINASPELISWTNKKDYKKNEQIKLVIESNVALDSFPKPPIIKELTLRTQEYAVEYDNGTVWTYFIFNYESSQSGSIKIPLIKVSIDSNLHKTKAMKINVLNE